MSKCGENIVYLWGERLSFCTATSRESVESGYTPNFLTNQKTAFFVSANHRAQKVPGEEREEKRERIDIMKALYFVEQL